SGSEQHVLSQPDGLLAQAIILRTAIALVPCGNALFGIGSLKGAAGQCLLDESALIERGVAGGCRNAFGGQRLQEPGSRESAELAGLEAEHVEVIRVARASV